MIKSAFIEKITRFIQWPENYEKEGEYINLGVLTNDSDVLETLQYYFKDQPVHSKTVNVREIKNAKDAADLHLLFIAGDYKGDYNKMMQELCETKVLLLTENNGKKRKGAHINLVKDYNRVSFEINPEKLNQSGFYVSSKLYAYGKIVKEP